MRKWLLRGVVDSRNRWGERGVASLGIKQIEGRLNLISLFLNFTFTIKYPGQGNLDQYTVMAEPDVARGMLRGSMRAHCG